MATCVCSYGQIAVVLKLPDPCLKVSVENKTINQNSFDVALSPNPTDGKVNLKVSSDKVINELTVEVHNLKGGIVFQEKLFCNSSLFIKNYNWSNFSSGIYVLNLRGGIYHNQQKFVIK